MSSARWFGGITLLLITAAGGFGQTTTYVVKSPTAEVTCGPGNPELYYVTNRLHQGDRVEVVREEPTGWLAIKPPVGSVSWINNRFLMPVGNDRSVWSVQSEADVEVLYGSEVRKDRPNVRSVYVKRGTLVNRAGETMSAQDGTWQMIKPPVAEVRYVRAADVAPEGGNRPSAVSSVEVTTGRSPPKDYAVPPVPPPSADTPGSAQAAWAEAQRAEKEDRVRDAIELYNKLGREVMNTDHDLAMRCFNQASWLQHKPSYAVDNRLRPMASGIAVGYTPQNAGGCVPAEFTFQGRLREAHQSLERKPTYVVEDSTGRIVAYATSAGADLNALLGKNVAVSGPACWCGSVRANYVRATRATPLQ
jgi:hypothetical protein